LIEKLHQLACELVATTPNTTVLCKNVKKHPSFLMEAELYWGPDRKALEYLYLSFHKSEKDVYICPKGNSKQFASMKSGFRFCGIQSVCECCAIEVKEKIKKTCQRKYGSDTVMGSPLIRKKLKDGMVEKYGVEFFSKTEHYNEKVKQTSLARYGVDHPTQVSEIKDRKNKTYIEKYGEGTEGRKILQEKRKQTCISKYGKEHFSQTDEYIEKRNITNINKFGEINPFMSEEIKKKIRETNLRKYGVDNQAKLQAIQDKMRNTSNLKFGGDYSQIHWSDYVKNIILNYEVFKENIDEYGIVGLAIHLSVPASTIYKYMNKYELSYPPITRSKEEKEICEFLDSNGITDYIMNDKKILNGKELDILLSNNNLAIEFNGLYWHSEFSSEKDQSYHFEKWIICQSKNIELISINSGEWSERKIFFKKYILDKLSKKKSVDVSNCDVKNSINSKKILTFLETYSYNLDTSENNIGIELAEELICVCCFNLVNDKICISNLSYKFGIEIPNVIDLIISHIIRLYGTSYNVVEILTENNYKSNNELICHGFELSDILQPSFDLVSSNYSKIIKNPTHGNNYDIIWNTGSRKWIRILND
jgi:hypothetical protein